jgi:hypothetical protein
MALGCSTLFILGNLRYALIREFSHYIREVHNTFIKFKAVILSKSHFLKIVDKVH